jgi:hypothetical protein
MCDCEEHMRKGRGDDADPPIPSTSTSAVHASVPDLHTPLSSRMVEPAQLLSRQSGSPSVGSPAVPAGSASNGTTPQLRPGAPSLLPRKLLEDVVDDESAMKGDDALLTFIKPRETVVMQPVRTLAARCRGTKPGSVSLARGLKSVSCSHAVASCLALVVTHAVAALVCGCIVHICMLLAGDSVSLLLRLLSIVE